MIEGLSEDPSGALWIGTSSGLTVLADHSFQNVSTNTSIMGAVSFLHRSRTGSLWIASTSGLCFIRQLQCVPVQGTSAWSINSDALFADSKDGSLWVAEGRNVHDIDGSTLQILRSISIQGDSDISALLIHNGQLLIGTQDGLQIYSAGRVSRLQVIGAVKSPQVHSLQEDGHGGVWMGTALGLARYENNTARMLPLTGAPPAMNVLQTFQDTRGSLWLILDRALLRVSSGQVESFRPDDLLRSATVLSVLEDREGNLWFGTESDGLAMLHRQKFFTYTMRDGLSGNVIRSVVQDPQRNIWIGTDGAGVDKFANGRFSALGTVNGLSSDSILSLAAQGEQLWVGTPTGLSSILHGSVRKYGSGVGLPDDFVRSLLRAADGTLWVGTAHGLSALNHERFTTYTRMDGLGSDFIGALLQTRSGEIWASTSGGVSRFARNHFTTLTTHDGLASNIVTAMHEDSDGTIWLASSGGIVNRVRANSIASLTSKVLPQTIYAVLEDASSHLWLSSRSGIFRVSRSELNRALDTHTDIRSIDSYGVSDGMTVRECSSGGHPEAWRMADGTLWFATMHGLAVVDPEQLNETAVPPLIVVESLSVDDHAYDPEHDWKFSPGSHRVAFQFAGLSYAAPQKVHFRYKLEGFDEHWVNAGTVHAAYYDNLPAGKYHFLVEASNDDASWSTTPASIRFAIKPHTYQTAWFYVLLTFVLAGVSYAIYWWRVRQVAAVYETVMGERSRIAREIHDTLAQGIVSISLQLEVVSRLMDSSVDSARQQLDLTRVLVRQSLAEARSSIWDLRMQNSEVQDLPKRLGSVLRRLTAEAHIAGTLKVHGTCRALPTDTEEELTKIAQEAITNAVKHSRCSTVELALNYNEKQMQLTIADNGVGLNASPMFAAQRGHFGIRGMQERTALIGGKLSLAPNPEGGMRVTVELPLS